MNPILITDYTLHSIIIILHNRNYFDKAQLFVSNLTKISKINLFSATLKETNQIFEIMNKYCLDFDDAYQLFATKTYNAELFTFDKDFNQIKDVKINTLLCSQFV